MIVALITKADANPAETEFPASLGVPPGQVAEIKSDGGPIHAVAEPDDTLRPGVGSVSHCLGHPSGTDEDPIAFGANPGRLLSLPAGIEDVNGMPRMTAVPMSVPPPEQGVMAPATRSCCRRQPTDKTDRGDVHGNRR